MQVGTTSAAYASGMAMGAAFAVLLTAASLRFALTGSVISSVLLGVLAVVLFAYAAFAARMWRRTRPSDLLVGADGLVVQGGPHHGRAIAWPALLAPYASVERRDEVRLELAWLLVGFPLLLLSELFVATVASSSRGGTTWLRSLPVARLRVHVRTGETIVLGETEDPEEAESLEAARATIALVVEGRRAVRQAPASPAEIVVCPTCGAPCVASEAPTSACMHCAAAVVMPDAVRRLAASARESSVARAESHRLVKRLLEQPPAGKIDARFRALAILQLAVWPIGWAAVALRVRATGWSSSEILYLLFPGVAVLSGYFLALNAATPRRALRALTLGFGALAPARDGELARCRRCHGALAAAEGVATCTYCSADNIVGIDLRSAVSAARAQQPTFDDVLGRHRERRVSAIGLVVVAALFACFWLAVTVAHAWWGA